MDAALIANEKIDALLRVYLFEAQPAPRRKSLFPLRGKVHLRCRLFKWLINGMPAGFLEILGA